MPVSAVSGEQVDVVADVLMGHLPPSPPLYPTGEVTDEPQAVMIGELVREAALESVRDELPTPWLSSSTRSSTLAPTAPDRVSRAPASDCRCG